MKPAADAKFGLWVSIALWFAVFLVFSQAWHCDFILYDDPAYVVHNTYVKAGINWGSVSWAFTSIHRNTFYWHPLTWLSHMLDCQLFGQEPNWHHMTNIIFHAVNTLLLFWLLFGMTSKMWRSAFVAGLFALHPLHVESVAWIAERKDVLCTFFWLLTLIAYYKYAKRPNILSYLLVLLLFIFGLMSKPMIVTLPFTLLLLDYWPLERISLSGDMSLYKKQQPYFKFSNLILEKVPFFLLSAFACIMTVIAQREIGAIKTINAYPFSVRLANSLISYIMYIVKMFVPYKLAVFYPHPGSSISFTRAIVCGVWLLIFTILIVRHSKIKKYLLFGWLWYLGTLFPVIGIIQVGWQARADRYTYITLVGLFVMLVWGIAEYYPKFKHNKRALVITGVLVLMTFAGLSTRQLRYWRNTGTLFKHAYDVTNNNFVALTILGIIASHEGHFDNAKSYLDEAIKIRPDYVYAHCELGLVYKRQHDFQKSKNYYFEALRHKPSNWLAHYHLADIFCREGNYSDALNHFQRSLYFKPDRDRTIDTMVSMINSSNIDSDILEQAVFEFERMTQKRKYRCAHLLYTLASLYCVVERYEDAIKTGEKALERAQFEQQVDLVEKIEHRLHYCKQALSKQVGSPNL